MKSRLIHIAAFGACLGAGFGSAGDAAAATPCEGLVALSLGGARVVASAMVGGASFVAPDGRSYTPLAPFCKVTAVASPVPDSLIGIELWLPAAAQWNGRFQGVGNGGYGGSHAVGVPAMLAGLAQGFAVASTDMGTTPAGNSNADTMIGHPQKWIDFGSRATHTMTTVSKELLTAFYGRSARYSYFNGCSTGGQQAMMSAQRYPADYDGILAGAPAANRTHGHIGLVWNWQALRASANSMFSSDNARDVTAAVVAACTVKSGGVAGDGFLTDPRGCDWDPAALQCTSAGQSRCLKPEQVAAARLIYDGTRTATTRQLVFPGWTRGAETDGQFGWGPQSNASEPQFGSLFKWVFGPAWDARSFDFDSHTDLVDAILAQALNANSSDLSAFRSRGGKLLAYHGWADPIIPAQSSINGYRAVVARAPASGYAGQLAYTQQYYRLFMAPGMAHCAGGPGPNAFGNRFSGLVVTPEPLANDPTHDALSALQRWVEQGVAPDRLVAAKYVQDQPALGVQMTRPLCVYPKLPRYKGSGATDNAASFVCADSKFDTPAYNPVPAAEYLN